MRTVKAWDFGRHGDGYTVLVNISPPPKGPPWDGLVENAVDHLRRANCFPHRSDDRFQDFLTKHNGPNVPPTSNSPDSNVRSDAPPIEALLMDELRKFRALYLPDLLPQNQKGPEDLQLLFDATQTFFPRLQRIFRHYACLDDAAPVPPAQASPSSAFAKPRPPMMTQPQFLAFAKDCRLIDKVLNTAAAQLIFGDINNRANSFAKRQAYAIPKIPGVVDSQPAATFSFAEFLASLMRMAEKKYGVKKPNLFERWLEILSMDVIPNAKSQDVVHLHELFASPVIGGILKIHNEDFRKIFECYSAIDSNDKAKRGAPKVPMVNLQRFAALFKDANLIDPHQPAVTGALKAAFRHSVRDSVLARGSDDSLRLGPAEFVEALFRFAVHMYCEGPTSELSADDAAEILQTFLRVVGPMIPSIEQMGRLAPAPIAKTPVGGRDSRSRSGLKRNSSLPLLPGRKKSPSRPRTSASKAS